MGFAVCFYHSQVYCCCCPGLCTSATARSFPAPLCCLKLLGQKGSFARAGLGRTGVVSLKTGTSLVLCFHGCAWEGHVGTRPPSPERRGLSVVTTTHFAMQPRGARGCVSARWKLSAGPPARGAGSDTFLTQTERRRRREILVMSCGIRYQTQPWLQAVREAAAPSDGEHDPELIPRRLLPVCACGKVLPSRFSQPHTGAAPGAVWLCAEELWMPQGCRLRM